MKPGALVQFSEGVSGFGNPVWLALKGKLKMNQPFWGPLHLATNPNCARRNALMLVSRTRFSHSRLRAQSSTLRGSGDSAPDLT